MEIIVSCEVYIATLGYSNYTAVGAVHSQKIADVVAATVSALNYIGASPRAIVPDNLKSAVTLSHRYDPVINEVFLDMANHYGMVVTSCKSGEAQRQIQSGTCCNDILSTCFCSFAQTYLLQFAGTKYRFTGTGHTS